LNEVTRNRAAAPGGGVSGWQRFPPVAIGVPGDHAEAGEGHVIGVDEEVLVSGAV
jgi:hypothetical protein